MEMSQKITPRQIYDHGFRSITEFLSAGIQQGHVEPTLVDT